MLEPPTPEEIKAWRLARDWMQKDLAAALIDATPHELARMEEFANALMRVRNWEQGATIPDRKNTKRLARIFADTETQR